MNLNEDVIWTRSGLYTVIWTGSITKTNRENINVKYNIVIYNIVNVLEKTLKVKF